LLVKQDIKEYGDGGEWVWEEEDCELLGREVKEWSCRFKYDEWEEHWMWEFAKSVDEEWKRKVMAKAKNTVNLD
jgi:hypothetical protein